MTTSVPIRLARPSRFRWVALAGIVAILVVVGVFFLARYHAAGIPGDLDGNGVVNQADLDILKVHYGQSGSSVPGDIDGNGKVNAIDLSLMVQNWGGSNIVATSVPIGFATGAGIPTHDEMLAYQKAGASFIRFAIPWDSGSSGTNGTFDKTQAISSAIAYANSIHLGVILLVDGSASLKGHQFAHNADFAAFVANVAAYFNDPAQYDPRYVWAIEVGNEPNINRFDSTTNTLAEKAAGYADLMIRVYDSHFENIKARTSRPVIIGGLARTGEPLVFTQDLFAPITVDSRSFPNGIKNHYDGWTFHPYDYNNTASQDLARSKGGFYDMAQTMSWFQSTFGAMPPVYITEYGQPTYPENATSLAHQVDSLNDVVYQLTKQSWNVKAFSWFSFMDKDNTSTTPNDHFGIIDKTTTFPIPQISQKPAYAAFQSIATTHTVPVSP